MPNLWVMSSLEYCGGENFPPLFIYMKKLQERILFWDEFGKRADYIKQKYNRKGKKYGFHTNM